MRCKAAAGGSIDNQQYFASIDGQADIVALSVFYCKIINGFHFDTPFLSIPVFNQEEDVLSMIRQAGWRQR